MSHPDEFDYGDALPSGPGARFLVVFVFVVFLASIFGTAVADNFFPVEGIRLVGTELAEQKARDQRADLWDGTLAKRFEEGLREHSRVRAAVLPTYAYLQLAYLDEASEGILVGKQHWLFLENRIHLSSLPDETLSGSLIATVIAVDRLLAAQNVALAVLPIPRKSTLAGSFLPSGVDAHPAIDDFIIDGLVERGVTTADMRASYAAEGPGQIYFKLDTHWTPTGARLAAEQLARVAGLLKAPAKRLGSLDTSQSLDPSAMGLGTLLSAGVVPASAFDLAPFDLPEGRMVVQTYPPSLAEWFKKPPISGPYIHVGTSFSKGRYLARLLSHYAGVPILDEAQRAQPFMSTLHHGLVKAGKKGGLKQVFWELPIGVAFTSFSSQGASFPHSVGESFLAIPIVRRMDVVGELLPSWSRLELGKTVPVGDQRLALVQIPGGILGHSGDGVAHLLIRGEAWGERVSFEYISDNFTLFYAVPKGPFEIDLPVLTSATSRAGIQLTILPDKPGELRIDDVALEHIPVGKTQQELVAVKTATGHVLKPKTPKKLGRRAAFLLQSKPGSRQTGKLTVTIRTLAPKGERQVSFEGMFPGCSIALDLGEEQGRLLESVSIDTDLEGFAITTSWLTGLE